MKPSVLSRSAKRLVLRADTAADLMAPNPISIDESASLQEAIAFLTDKSFSAAPVVDEAGRPVGVLSQTDIVIHDRNNGSVLPTAAKFYAEADLTADSGKFFGNEVRAVRVDKTLVRDIMTPVVLSVSPSATATEVVSELLAYKVHRLFVVDDGVLIGVISAFDVLRKLHNESVREVQP